MDGMPVTTYDVGRRTRISSMRLSVEIVLLDRTQDILGNPSSHIQKSSHMRENRELSIKALRGE